MKVPCGFCTERIGLAQSCAFCWAGIILLVQRALLISIWRSSALTCSDCGQRWLLCIPKVSARSASSTSSLQLRAIRSLQLLVTKKMGAELIGLFFLFRVMHGNPLIVFNKQNDALWCFICHKIQCIDFNPACLHIV